MGRQTSCEVDSHLQARSRRQRNAHPPPAVRSPQTGRRRIGWATSRPACPLATGNGARPRRLSGGGGQRSTDAGSGADERRHLRVARGGLRQGLGHRRRPRHDVPRQHLPGVQLGVERPVRAAGRRGAVGRARADVRRGLPGRRRGGGGAPGLGGAGPGPGRDGRGLGHRHHPGPGHRPPALERGAERPRRVAAGGALDLLPALLHPPGAALRGRHRGHRGPLRQAPVRGRGDGADRQHGGARHHDGGVPDHARADARPRPHHPGEARPGHRRHPRRRRVRGRADGRAAPHRVPSAGDARHRRPQAPPPPLALGVGRAPTRRRGAARRRDGHGQPGRRGSGGVPVLLRRVPRAVRDPRPADPDDDPPRAHRRRRPRRHGLVRGASAVGARRHVAAAAAGVGRVRRPRAPGDAGDRGRQQPPRRRPLRRRAGVARHRAVHVRDVPVLRPRVSTRSATVAPPRSSPGAARCSAPR